MRTVGPQLTLLFDAGNSIHYMDAENPRGASEPLGPQDASPANVQERAGAAPPSPIAKSAPRAAGCREVLCISDRVPNHCIKRPMVVERFLRQQLQPEYGKCSLDPSQIEIVGAKNLQVSELISQTQLMVRL